MSFQTQESELGFLSNIVLGIIENETGLSSDILRVDSQFAEIGLVVLLATRKGFMVLKIDFIIDLKMDKEGHLLCVTF